MRACLRRSHVLREHRRIARVRLARERPDERRTHARTAQAPRLELAGRQGGAARASRPAGAGARAHGGTQSAPLAGFDDSHREARRRVVRRRFELRVDGGIGGQYRHGADETPRRVRPHVGSAAVEICGCSRTAASKASSTALARAAEPQASPAPGARAAPRRSPRRRWQRPRRLRRRCSTDAWWSSSRSLPRRQDVWIRRRSQHDPLVPGTRGVSDAGVPSVLVWPFACLANVSVPSAFAQHVRAPKARPHRFRRPSPRADILAADADSGVVSVTRPRPRVRPSAPSRWPRSSPAGATAPRRSASRSSSRRRGRRWPTSGAARR